ncbi:MAG TPA: DNA polymerase III subunit delta' [Beijerinckiaceae bacterium]|jgi:DNA polymerase-3 subunit delta'|nr:DNA polymerase III subunit delta' [Beijerinckiaceae bacterium]
MSGQTQIDRPLESDRFGEAPHPRATEALFGHAGAEQELLDSFRSGRLPQAWIIGGREGIGKATLAWRFARFLLVHGDEQADVVRSAQTLWVSPDHPVAKRVISLGHADLSLLRRQANERGKGFYTEIRADEVRHMIEMFHHSAGEGGWRVAIIDCAEDLNRSGANALLKLIEEPPRHALFLIVSHRPARVLPTIRSRCRMLALEPLSTQDVVRAVANCGEPWSNMAETEITAAAERSGGSVRDALRLLDGGGLALAHQIDDLLDRLPAIDWRGVHTLADMVAGRDRFTDYEALVAHVFDWLDDRVRTKATTAARLAPFAEVWEKIAAATREAEALNLDKRPLILSIFADVAEAVRVSEA